MRRRWIPVCLALAALGAGTAAAEPSARDLDRRLQTLERENRELKKQLADALAELKKQNRTFSDYREREKREQTRDRQEAERAGRNREDPPALADRLERLEKLLGVNRDIRASTPEIEKRLARLEERLARLETRAGAGRP